MALLRNIFLGQVQSMHLLAFDVKGVASRQEFPVTRVGRLRVFQRVGKVGIREQIEIGTV